MKKYFCLGYLIILLVVTVLFLNSCSNSQKNELENRCSNVMNLLLSQAYELEGDYSKLSDGIKDFISEDKFNDLYFVEEAQSSDCVVSFNWTYPIASEKKDFILVKYEYIYDDYNKDELNNFDDHMYASSTVYVKMIETQDRIMVEDVFEPITPDKTYFPEWAK